MSDRIAFEVPFGDTWDAVFDIKDDQTGDLIDLTGATAKLRVYDYRTGDKLIAEATLSVNDVDNTVTISLDSTFWENFGTTDKIKSGDYPMRFVITIGSAVNSYPADPCTSFPTFKVV